MTSNWEEKKHKKNREELLDSFIDDLSADLKPRVYKEDKVTPELEDEFEVVRKIKRYQYLKDRKESHYKTSKTDERTWNKKLVFRSLTAVAAVFLLIFFGGIINNDTGTGIVKAMVQNYEKITAYTAEVKVTSIDDGEVTHETTRKIEFKKPDLYRAVETWDNVKRTNLSDGETLWMINETEDKNATVTVESLFPERELWRYHLGTQISGVDSAAVTKNLGREEIAGRSAVVIKYKYEEKEKYWHKIWIDEDEKFPLKIKLRGGPDTKLVVEYKELDFNPNLHEATFALENLEIDIEQYEKKETFNKLLEDTEELEALMGGDVYNLKRTELEDVDDVDTKDKEDIISLIENLKLDKVGYIDADWMYEGVLRYKDDEGNFLDIYQGVAEDEAMLLFGEGEVGEIGERNLLEFIKAEAGVFDNYPHPVNYLRFRLKSEREGEKEDKIAFVSNLPKEAMLNLAEGLTGEKVKLFEDSIIPPEYEHEYPIKREGY